MNRYLNSYEYVKPKTGILLSMLQQ